MAIQTLLSRCILAVPIALIAAVGIAAYAPDAQALPPGVHCIAATAENELTPPPPLWELKHERRPTHLPPPLCPAHSVPTTAPGANGSTTVTSEPAVTPSPNPLAGEIKPLSERTGYPSAPFYYAGDGYHTPELWAGISVGIQVGNPTLTETVGVHSLGQISLAENKEIVHTAEMGWHRDPTFGAGSRLFTYINKDHYKSNGEEGGDCYNCATPQVGAPYTQNQELEVGHTYQFSVDYSAGSWWFGVGSSWIAHESGSFWGGKFTSGNWMSMYGEVYDKSGPKSQMGNGTIGTKAGSLIMTNPYLYGLKGELFTTAGHSNQAKNAFPNDLPGYDVGLYSKNEREWHYGGE